MTIQAINTDKRTTNGGQEPRRQSGSANHGQRLWSAREVSEFLDVPVATLHQWRYLGRGPSAFRVGKHLRYDPELVYRWLVDECAGKGR